jgi:glycosyltransferase involved in cell wall biosynthesis
MKILFVAPGASLHATRWIERAQKIGFEVVLFSQDGVVPKSNYRTITVDTLGIPKSNNPILQLIKDVNALKRVIGSEVPDFVHIHWLFSPVALALSFVGNIKVVGTPWGSDILYTNEKESWNRKQRIIYKFSIKLLIKRIDYFTCDAAHLKDRLVKLGADKNLIQIVYFGTDASQFTPERRSDSCRKTWGLSNSDIAILSNRNLYKVYDIPTLIKAFKKVSERYKNVFLIVGGSGPELPNLEEQVKSQELQDKVRFLGKLEMGEFEASVASSDIYVSTSTSDGGLASSIAEAMASEVPVLVTDFGENSDWLEDGRNGFLFPVGGWESLAEKMIYLIENPSLRLAMGKSARQTVQLRLDPDFESQKLAEIYKTKI